jgi:hypothetical protein
LAGVLLDVAIIASTTQNFVFSFTAEAEQNWLIFGFEFVNLCPTTDFLFVAMWLHEITEFGYYLDWSYLEDYWLEYKTISL